MARFEVLALDADRELIRTLAKRLADDSQNAAEIRATVRRTIAGESPDKGGVLRALRRSPPGGFPRSTPALRCVGKSNWNVKAFGVHTLNRNSLVYEFSFARAAAPIRPDTGEVIFEIDFGGWRIESRFKTKDMLYRGQLAR